MWLVSKNIILTKENLSKRSWTRAIQCCFCTAEESVVHMFVQCPSVQSIWFWMGQCQIIHRSWGSLHEVISFSFSLSGANKRSISDNV
jgi:zinc-binding in reverse transcriptase